MTNMAQTILVCGVLAGAMLFTILADNLGRKPVFLFSLWGIVVVGVLTAFTQSYITFAIARFFTGMVQQVGIYFILYLTSIYLLIMEFKSH